MSVVNFIICSGGKIVILEIDIWLVIGPDTDLKLPLCSGFEKFYIYLAACSQSKGKIWIWTWWPLTSIQTTITITVQAVVVCLGVMYMNGSLQGMYSLWMACRYQKKLRCSQSEPKGEEHRGTAIIILNISTLELREIEVTVCTGTPTCECGNVEQEGLSRRLWKVLGLHTAARLGWGCLHLSLSVKIV